MSFAKPAQFVGDELGNNDDTIHLYLGKDKVVITTGWEQTEGVLTQPGQWTLRMGWGSTLRSLIQKYPKNTPFTLQVGGNVQAVGFSDGFVANQPVGGAAEFTVSGRDKGKKLKDTYVKAQVSVNVDTYAKLVWFAMQKCGLAPSGDIDPNILHTDNAANRRIKSGCPIGSVLPHRTVKQILDDVGLGGSNVGAVHTIPLAKVGWTWLKFIRNYIDRAGLMLWAAADGSFVLSAPDANQSATYQLRIKSGQPKSGANMVGCSYQDMGTDRFTEVIVYARGGGKVAGFAKSHGKFLDQEMIDAGYGDQPMVFRDVHCHSQAEAEYFARRKIAEQRREGWKLEYTIPGLTLPFAGDGGKTKAVIIPDTIIEVQDDERGLYDRYYIESVTRRRSPATTTTARLMRIDDLIFGTDDPPE